MFQQQLPHIFNRNKKTNRLVLVVWCLGAYALACMAAWLLHDMYIPLAKLMIASLTTLLGAADIVNADYKQMLTTDYNTLYLERQHTPLTAWLAIVFIMLWLPGTWRSKIGYALTGIALVYIVHLLWLFICVFYTQALGMLGLIVCVHVCILAVVAGSYAARH